MGKRIFVHIGTHKTGTTSIQFFLSEARERLRQCGIFVPHAGTGLAEAPAGHHNVAYELCNHPSYDPGLAGVAGLLAELRDIAESVAVISSENLQFLHRSPERLRGFDRALADLGYERTYVVYFRNTEDYFLSLYSQLKITGRLPEGDFPTLRARTMAQGFLVDRIGRYFEFDFSRYVREWEAVIGPHVVRFDYDEVARGAGVLPTFLEAIGASAEILDLSRRFPRANVTMIGRNEMCPCQSGKRWKHCHGVRG